MNKGAEGKRAWVVKKLSDVAVVFDGPHATPKTGDAGPVFLGISALQDGVVNLGETRHVTEEDFRRWTRRVKPQANDVVFSYETRLGQAAIIPPGLECCLGRRMGLVRLNEKHVVPRFFLYHYISPAFREFLESRTIRGATVDRISIREFPSFPIAVPPLPEQRRIVGILDEAFDGIAAAKANAEKNLQNARDLFESHLQAVFTQRGDGWLDKTLGDICVKITDGEHLRPKVTSSGVPFLSAKDVLDHDVVFTDPLFVSEADALKFRKRCDPEMGDILIVSRGATVGRTCVVKTRSVFCLLGSVILLKVAAALSAAFIAYALKSPSIRKQLMTASEASAQQAIYLRDIKLLNIGCPSITKQHAIVSKLDALRAKTQRLESIYRQKLAALDALKKSLLDQAFSGVL